jgi:hypothetical protein
MARLSMRSLAILMLLAGLLGAGCRNSQEMPPFPVNDGAASSDGGGAIPDGGAGGGDGSASADALPGPDGPLDGPLDALGDGGVDGAVDGGADAPIDVIGVD